MIIDAHLHAVSPDTSRYPLRQVDLPGNSWVKTAPASAEDLIAQMDAAGVAKGVLVQPVGAYGTDNSYVADAGAAHPDRLATVCVIDMTADDRLAQLRYWTQERGIGGVRLFSVPTPKVSWLDDPATFEIWEACQEWSVKVSVCLLPEELPRLGQVLARFPDTPVALDHCGFADFTDGPPWNAAQPLWELAEHQNLYLKVTTNVLDAAGESATRKQYGQHGAEGNLSQNREAKQSTDREAASLKAQKHLMATLARRFGAARLMWGSDYPQVQNRPYSELATLARTAATALPPAEQPLFLASTFQSLWPTSA